MFNILAHFKQMLSFSLLLIKSQSLILGAKAEKIQRFFKVVVDIYLNHVVNYTLLTTGKF